MSRTQDSIVHKNERMPYLDIDLEYSDDESSAPSLYSSNESPSPARNGFIVPPSKHRKTLIVDEIEANDFPKSPKSKMIQQHVSTSTNSCTLDKNRTTACSCCLSYIQSGGIKKNNLNLIPCNHSPEQKSYFESLMSKVWSGSASGNESNTTSTEHANQVMAKASLEYQIKSVLMESWIEKKGSGLDMFGSKSWKSRWCQLVLASIPGYEMDVPVLLVSWHSSMPLPSNIIVLDMKLAITKDSDDISRFCFDVVSEQMSNTTTTTSSSTNMARTFALRSLDERQEWISKINTATRDFQKARKVHRMKNEPLPPTSPTQKKTWRAPNTDLEGLSLCFD